MLFLAITQGLSELLPISSSAHLILLGRIISMPTSTLLLTSLHIGTSVAILIFFRKQLFKDLFSKKKILFLFKIVLSVIPAGILGLLFESKIEEILRASWIIAFSLIFWGVVMIIIENMNIHEKVSDVENISWKRSLLMGFSQVFALIPGTSRSGITTITGILLGVNKYVALEYGLLLGLPILMGSSLWEIIKNLKESSSQSIQGMSVISDPLNLFVILIVPFAVGLFSLSILKKVKKEKWLSVFGIYRIIVGIIILLSL